MNDKVNFRMCIHCRKLKPKMHMVRIAKQNNEVVIDTDGKAGGRGAYLCSQECFLLAQKARKLERALKCRIDPEIYQELKDVFECGKQQNAPAAGTRHEGGHSNYGD